MQDVRRTAGWVAGLSATGPVMALAEEAPKAQGYGGADYVWFITIGLILLYGVYDTFLKKT
jgi:hypothetical protein